MFDQLGFQEKRGGCGKEARVLGDRDGGGVGGCEGWDKRTGHKW